MAVSFERTWRTLGEDGGQWRTVGTYTAGVLTAAWVLWFLYGHVGVYELSRKTTLEVKAAAHPVASRIAGRVVGVTLDLGRAVKAGDTLVELDAEEPRVELTRVEAHVAALRSEVTALVAEIGAHERALEAYRGAASSLSAESRARAEEASAQSRFADQHAASQHLLLERQFVAAQIVRESDAKAEAGRAAVRAHTANTARLRGEALVETADREAEITELKRKLADLEGSVVTEEAEAQAIRERIKWHYIRAPIDGRVGRLEILRVGTVVEAGQVLGTVVPDGDLQAVGWFASSATGRIRPGQAARLRLDGFPWTHYGTLSARVASVGNDPWGDEVRVELALAPESAPAIPLGHGLTGTAEIRVEELSPARLVLRAVGYSLTTRQATQHAPTEAFARSPR